MKQHWPLASLLGVLLWPVPAPAAVIGRSTEISLGREAAQEYERTAAVDTDPVLRARVQRIGSRLIAAEGATAYPFEFHAVETNGINAFALPGGFVYVFRGLAQLMPGDDALAFILAHEISHVTRRHGVRQLEKSLAVTSLLNLALRPGLTSGVLQLAINMHYSRHDEAEADRLGLQLMARAGFDPAQAPEAMAVIGRVAKSEHRIPALLRSHPLTENRVAALRREAAAPRAAPRPAVPAIPAFALPEAAALPLPPAPVTRSALFPLQVGMRWTYRVGGAESRQSLTTVVLEEQPGQAGVFTVQTELDDGLKGTHRLVVTNTGVYQASLPFGKLAAEHQDPRAREWRMAIALPAEARAAAPLWESVRVPAGEYRAARVVQHSPAGEAATVWLAPGVGIVRRVWERTGMVEELRSFQRPAVEEERAKKEQLSR